MLKPLLIGGAIVYVIYSVWRETTAQSNGGLVNTGRTIFSWFDVCIGAGLAFFILKYAISIFNV